MSWASKTLKKATKYIKKNPWVLDPVGGFYQAGTEAWNGIKKNWTDIRTPLTYAAIAAAAAYTGGAALGLMGVGTAGLSGAAGAAAGASSATGAAALGAATGAATGMQANEARKAAEQQEKIAKQEAAENLRLAGLTPGEQKNFDTVDSRRYSSQYRRNLVTRDKNKKLNSSSSTLG
jgi:hypothetical protein